MKVWGGSALSMSGGSLNVRSLDVGSATFFDFSGGTITVNGGAFIPKITSVTLQLPAQPKPYASSNVISGPGAPILSLSNGATLTSSASQFWVGVNGGQGAVSLNDAGSALTLSSGTLTVGAGLNNGGNSRSVGTVSIANGASANIFAQTSIGYAGGQGWVSVNGAQSILQPQGIGFYVGDGAAIIPSSGALVPSEGTLLIANGGSVNNKVRLVAGFGGVGFINVQDLGSNLHSGGSIQIGDSGFSYASQIYRGGGTLQLSNGGRADSTGDFIIGDEGGQGYLHADAATISAGGTLSVGSSIARSSPVLIPSIGTLSLTGGAQANSSTYVLVGSAQGKGWISVDGTSSKLQSGREIKIGTGDAPGFTVPGEGTLTITNSAQTSATGDIYTGYYGGKGTVGVDGGTLTAGQQLFVGAYVTNKSNTTYTSIGTLVVTNGGRVSTGTSGIAIGISGGSGYASVSGPQSLLQSASGMYVGADRYVSSSGTPTASVGTLLISNGGMASGSGEFFIGEYGAQGFADVSGGTLNAGKALYIGYGPNSTSSTFPPTLGTLSVRSGGVVSTSGDTDIGLFGGQGYISIDGSSSRLHTSALQVVGASTLVVTGGAKVDANWVRIGADGGNGYVRVDAANSTLGPSNLLPLQVGYSQFSLDGVDHTGTGTLILTNGGQSSASAAYIGFSGGLGRIIVAGGHLDIGPGQIYVGGSKSDAAHLSQALVALSGGGSMTTTSVVIGESGASGTVSLAGLGTKWINTTDIYVGNDGVFGNATTNGIGTVTVSDHSVLTNSGIFRAYPAGTLIVNGGALTTKDLDLKNAGSFNFAAGTITVDGGLLTPMQNQRFDVAGTLSLIHGARAIGATTLNISGGQVLLGANGNALLSFSGITIGAGGYIDLANNKMIVDYSTLDSLPSDLRNYLMTGDIGSNLADPKHRLGYADNSILRRTSFAGISFPAGDFTQMFVQNTFAGDATLDGKVDISDLYALASHWQTSNDFWTNGDFNYDGNVNVQDLTLLAQNWQAGVSSPLGQPQFGMLLSSLGLPEVSIPEPGSTGVLGEVLLAIRLLARCRRVRK